MTLALNVENGINFFTFLIKSFLVLLLFYPLQKTMDAPRSQIYLPQVQLALSGIE